MSNDQCPVINDHGSFYIGHAELEPLGPTPKRVGRARPPGRALRLSRRSQVGTSARRKLRRRSARAVRRLERTAPQPFRQVPVQRPHGAASAADARLPTAAALRDTGGCHPAVAAPALGHGRGSSGDAAAAGGAAVHGADRHLACAGALRSGAAPSQSPHPPAPRLPHDRRDHVVAGTVTGARAAADPAPAPDALSVFAGDSDVDHRRADYAIRFGALSVLRRSTPGGWVIVARRSANWRATDVGAGRINAVDPAFGDFVLVLL